MLGEWIRELVALDWLKWLLRRLWAWYKSLFGSLYRGAGELVGGILRAIAEALSRLFILGGMEIPHEFRSGNRRRIPREEPHHGASTAQLALASQTARTGSNSIAARTDRFVAPGQEVRL